MKFAAVFAFFSVALAAPSQLKELNGMSKFKRDLPSLTPVNIPNFDSDFDIKCGKDTSTHLHHASHRQTNSKLGRTTVKGGQIHLAVSWGTCLQRDGQTVGGTQMCPPSPPKWGKESLVCSRSTDEENSQSLSS